MIHNLYIEIKNVLQTIFGHILKTYAISYFSEVNINNFFTTENFRPLAEIVISGEARNGVSEVQKNLGDVIFKQC